MNKVLATAVIDYAAFLSLSDDRDVHPDVAVAQLESLASLLQQFTEGERREFVTYIAEVRLNEAKKGASSARLEFLELLAADLGLE